MNGVSSGHTHAQPILVSRPPRAPAAAPSARQRVAAYRQPLQPHSPPPQQVQTIDRRTAHTEVAIIHDTRVQVVHDPVRVPPPVDVTWQALMPYSQNITGQLFDFYDTDSQDN